MFFSLPIFDILISLYPLQFTNPFLQLLFILLLNNQLQSCGF